MNQTQPYDQLVSSIGLHSMYFVDCALVYHQVWSICRVDTGHITVFGSFSSPDSFLISVCTNTNNCVIHGGANNNAFSLESFLN